MGCLLRHPFFICAEDDPDAVFLLRAALRKLRAESLLIHCSDGEELMRYLLEGLDRKETPAFVLLDLRMPKVNGFEALRRIRGTSGLERLPVLVCSSSPLESDIQLAAALGATDYIVKPNSFEELCRKLSALLTRFGLA